MDNQARSHVQSQEFVPNVNVLSDVSDVNSPSGSVVSEFSERSISVRRFSPVKVSAAMLVSPEDRRSISRRLVWLVKKPEGKAASRKSARMTIFFRALIPENVSEFTGPMIPPDTVNSSRLVRLDNI